MEAQPVLAPAWPVPRPRRGRFPAEVTATMPWAGPLDLRSTFGDRQGRGDPAVRIESKTCLWRALWTPAGAVTVRVAHRPGRLRLWAWGAGAKWAATDGFPRWVGAYDRPEALVARHPAVARAQRRLQGLRLSAGRDVFDAMWPTILAQRVKSEEANRSWRLLLERYGSPAPGPGELRLAPRPETVARIGLPSFHAIGVERSRALTLLRVAHHAGYVARAAGLAPAEAVCAWRRLPGIGPWTAMHAAALVHGWADAVVVGDFHIPHTVGFALTGRPRSDDSEMLQLLEPYRGQRGRVIRLLTATGRRAPAFGARRATFRDYVRIGTERERRRQR